MTETHILSLHKPYGWQSSNLGLIRLPNADTVNKSHSFRLETVDICIIETTKSAQTRITNIMCQMRAKAASQRNFVTA